MLIEWATHWSNTGVFEDFAIEVLNDDGGYDEAECQEYEYAYNMEGLFGCLLDPSLLDDDRSYLG